MLSRRLRRLSGDSGEKTATLTHRHHPITGSLTELRRERGYMLLEMVIAMSILATTALLSADILISTFRSEHQLRDRAALIDNSDMAKTWLAAKLQPAALPLEEGDWNRVMFRSGPDCVILELDDTTKLLEGRQGATCPDAEMAPAITIAQWVSNTEEDPLFVFKNDNGDVLEPTAQLSQATKIEMRLLADRDSDLTTAYRREMTYDLGGAFVSGELADNSVTTLKIQDGAITTDKIADSAISGTKIANGAVTASKLSSDAKKTTFNFVLTAADSTSWSIDQVGTWWAPSASSYSRSGLVLGDYCISGKTLELRGVFLVYNPQASGLGLRFKLVKAPVAGTPVSDAGAMDPPSGVNVSASTYNQLTTPWVTVNCAGSGVNDPQIYWAQATAASTSPVSTGLNFNVPNVTLQLRYS